MPDDPKVSKLRLVEREESDVDAVLRYAMGLGLQRVVVLGTMDDETFHFDSVATNHEVLWLLKLAENHLFTADE